MMPQKLNGMGVALVTPFAKDKSVDYVALARIIDHQIASGADFIVALGTTSENPTLTSDERSGLLRFIAHRVDGRVPLVAGVGGNDTLAVAREMICGDYTGYSAFLSVVPFYNKPTQRGIFAHFSHLAQQSPLPIILYNVPGRTGVDMSVDTTLRLAAHHANIIGIKDASGNIDVARALIDGAPRGFSVFSGEDSLTLDMLSAGACGVISVIGNALTARFSALVHNVMKGDVNAAEVCQSQLRTMMRLMFADGNPAGIKALLKVMGLCGDDLRLPLVNVSPEIEAAIAEEYQILSSSR